MDYSKGLTTEWEVSRALLTGCRSRSKENKLGERRQ